MLDNITIRAPYHPPQTAFKGDNRGSIWYNDIQFKPTGFDPANNVKGYVGEWENLNIYIYPRSIEIKNSIHKFIQDGFNYDDLPLSVIEPAFYKIGDKMNFEVMGATIHNLEYGLNIITDEVDKIYNGFKMLGASNFYPMHSKNKVYGSKCGLTQSFTKGYNKTFQHTLEGLPPLEHNYFRFEVGSKKMQYFARKGEPIQIFNVRDLCEQIVWRGLINDLIGKFKKIERGYIPPEFANPREAKIYGTFIDPHCRAFLKENSKHTYKKELAMFRALQKRSKDIELIESVAELLAEKGMELLEN